MDCVACQAPLSMGILQARILGWVASPSSRGSSQPRDRTQACLHCRPVLYHLSHQGNHYLWENPVLPVRPTWPFPEASVALRTLLPFSIHREGFREEVSHHVNPQTVRRGSWFGSVLSSESTRAKVKMSWGCDSQKVPTSGATWAKWKLWKYPGQEANK